MASSSSYKTLSLLCVLLALASVQARLVLPSIRLWSEPMADEAALHARLLVHRNDWATISTNSIDFPGTPFGHVLSYSDGIGKAAKNSTGEIFFYLTKLDFIAQNLEKDARASLSISLAQEGEHACKMDVEDPTCWKITIIGRVVPITSEEKEKFALQALFSRHPQMAMWPRGHGFSAYVMQIDTMILFDYYGGAKHIKPADYYNIKLTDE